MTGSIPRTRDLRIDALRGLALLILYSDHIRGNIVALYTPMAIGLSDMSDVFVFLSGYSCGMAYGRRLREHGLSNCARRCWLRAGQIYAVKVAVTMLSLPILMVLEKWVEPNFFGVQCNLQLVREFPLQTLIAVETFRLELFQYFVLAMYIIFLLMLPAVLVGLTRFPMATFAASSLLYVSVQLWPDVVTLPMPWNKAMFFNPFAWQFLFVGACGLAMMNPDTRAKLRLGWPITFLALCLLAGTTAAHLNFDFLWTAWTDKQDLGPVRLLHFFAFAIVAWRFIPDSKVLARITAIRPLIVCGRYPLVAYCAGGILAICGEAVLHGVSRQWLGQVVVNLAGWIGCIAATGLWGLAWQHRSVRPIPSGAIG